MKPIHLTAALVVAAIAAEASAQDLTAKRLDQLEATQAQLASRVGNVEAGQAAILQKLDLIAGAVGTRGTTTAWPATIAYETAPTCGSSATLSYTQAPMMVQRFSTWRLRWPHRTLQTYLVYP